MAAFTAKDVQALREKTGVGMMDCKKALTASDGDMEKAIEFLRERGLAAAAKKASRIAAEGVVDAYVAENVDYADQITKPAVSGVDETAAELMGVDTQEEAALLMGMF